MPTYQNEYRKARPQQSWMSRHPIITTLIVLFLIGSSFFVGKQFSESPSVDWLIELLRDDKDAYDPNAAIATQEANTDQTNTISNTQEANTDQTNTVKISRWIFKEWHDDFDNMHYRMCVLEASNEIHGLYNKTRAFLGILQIDNEYPGVCIMADIPFHANFVGDEHVRLKFDNESPFKVDYVTSPDGPMYGIFLGSTKKILQNIEIAKTMTAELPMNLASKQRASFYLTGYSETCKFNVENFH